MSKLNKCEHWIFRNTLNNLEQDIKAVKEAIERKDNVSACLLGTLMVNAKLVAKFAEQIRKKQQ